MVVSKKRLLISKSRCCGVSKIFFPPGDTKHKCLNPPKSTKWEFLELSKKFHVLYSYPMQYIFLFLTVVHISIDSTIKSGCTHVKCLGLRTGSYRLGVLGSNLRTLTLVQYFLFSPQLKEGGISAWTLNHFKLYFLTWIISPPTKAGSFFWTKNTFKKHRCFCLKNASGGTGFFEK